MSKVTFFKTQFPFNNVVETSPALLLEDAQKFVDVDLNIGWAMKTVNSYFPNKNNKVALKDGDHVNDRRVVKKCQGSIMCDNGACALYKKQLRPPVEQKLIANKKCIYCNNAMNWIQSAVTVEYYFSFIRSECTMNHKVNRFRKIEHLHSSYVQKHLTNDQQKKVYQIILKNPAATPGGVIAEISMRSDEISKDVEDINPVLLNRERTKHELRAAKIRNDLALVKGTDLFEEFSKIEDEYPGYILSAELVASKSCIIFSCPEMAMVKLPFVNCPMITDVIFKAVPNGFHLCSTVIFVPEMKKHVVIFQAIIKKLDPQQFAVYFKALFEKFAIKADNFLGMIMDFSQAQREGFYQAFNSSFPDSGILPTRLLKGSYMHWKQSVQRVVSNHSLVPAEKSNQFVSLTYKLLKTTVEEVFVETAQSIIREFPNVRRWLQWWLQPTISSMIYNCQTVLSDALRKHSSRTSNAIESYHSALYRLIPTRKALNVSLRLILQVCRTDGRLIKSYYKFGLAPFYTKTSSKRKNRSKPVANDGRAPDCNKAIFTSQKKRKLESLDTKVESQCNEIVSPIKSTKDAVTDSEDDLDLYFDQIDQASDSKVSIDLNIDESLVVFEQHGALMLKALGGIVDDPVPVESDFDFDTEAILREFECLKYNRYDSILIDSYKKYTSNIKTMDEKETAVMGASAMIKGFVWGIPSSTDDVYNLPQFTDGEPACCV
ncbi:hypothetical protein INT47_007556 [Mucor saturninus]|uniref:Uncharacterized protein n=1 Tax=Mucor saturninus TaxID=64648 RepID=A0A8H7RAA5_9FUNG|nr:hypothetical protein INT47_007556 [Mucor saturninus]